MGLFSYLDGIRVVAYTFAPFFLAWACIVLWLKSRSPWSLAAVAGAGLAIAGVVIGHVAMFVHYNAPGMEAPVADSWGQFSLVPYCVGQFIAAFALVGYARKKI
jgi:hypothetical protein